MLCQYIEMKSFNGIIFDLTDGMKMRGVKGAANGSPKNRSSVVSVYYCKEKALRETKQAWQKRNKTGLKERFSATYFIFHKDLLSSRKEDACWVFNVSFDLMLSISIKVIFQQVCFNFSGRWS